MTPLNEDLMPYRATGKGENCSLSQALWFTGKLSKLGFITGEPFATAPINGGTETGASALADLGATPADELFYQVRVTSGISVPGADPNQGYAVAPSIKALGHCTTTEVQTLLQQMFGGGPAPVNIDALMNTVTAHVLSGQPLV